MAMLEIRSLTKSYASRTGVATKALRGFDLSVERGEFVVLMGRSGCGKTTLFNLIAGIDRPSGGTIFLDGTDVTALTGDARAHLRRDRLGFVFQDFNLLDTLTLGENVFLALALKRQHEGIEVARDMLA